MPETATQTDSDTSATSTVVSFGLPSVVKVAKNLGSAALSSPLSVSLTNPIFDVQSKDIKFVYPLTPVGPAITSDYPLSPNRSYYDDTYYDTVDDDVDAQVRIVKYFYERMFNKWIFSDYKKLLHLFKISENQLKKLKVKILKKINYQIKKKKK